MSSVRALCCLPSVKKQKHVFQVFFVDRGRHRKNSWRQGLTKHKKVDEERLFAGYVKEKKLREPEEKKELAQTLKTVYVEATKKEFVQYIIKQLLHSVFVISRIIKISVRVISLSLRLRLTTPTSSLIMLDITQSSPNNCLQYHLKHKEMLTVACIENFASTVEAWGPSDGKKVQDCAYVFGPSPTFQKGMDWWKQMSSKRSFTCIRGIFFPLKPFRDFTLCSVYILYPACLLLSVCSLHFTVSLHFTPGFQSAVRSPQSTCYTDRIWNTGCGND